ncbi:E3 ubiquitin ligase BIG BROTHER-related isoform X1 [Elaeis guineensis]|uniref:E3 ubiquitin ligase BIG BROTHER-related isoform X1 n=1 Tax=Elaeis guineensis var. tenera TaxID=51953 RepID=UPI003C6DA6F9
MENSKESGAGDKIADESPSPNSPPPVEGEAEPTMGAAPPPARLPSRMPFTSLSQVDADLALARALQEQERAYMMLRMNGGQGSDFESSDAGSYEYEDGDDPDHPIDEGGSAEGSDYGEDAFDANDRSVDPAEFESDEAFARALQDAEEAEVAVRLMALAGLNDWGMEDHGDHGSHSQDAWEEVDPDDYSYEELVALGEVVGTENRGLSADTIASLPSVNYEAGSAQDGNTDQCVICRLEYEDGESLVMLSCKHTYHSECINKWLQINKFPQKLELTLSVQTYHESELLVADEHNFPFCL